MVGCGPDPLHLVVESAVGNPVAIKEAADLWIVADEGRLGHEFVDAYADQQRTGFIESLDREGAWLLIGGIGGQMVGLVAGFRAPEPKVAYLAWLGVDPRRWGVGIGGRLVQVALDHARARGDKAMTLWVHTTNLRARRFYEDQGFRPSGAKMLTPDDSQELLEYRIALS